MRPAAGSWNTPPLTGVLFMGVSLPCTVGVHGRPFACVWSHGLVFYLSQCPSKYFVYRGHKVASPSTVLGLYRPCDCPWCLRAVHEGYSEQHSRRTCRWSPTLPLACERGKAYGAFDGHLQVTWWGTASATLWVV